MNYDHLTPQNTALVIVAWLDIVKGDNYNEDEDVQTVEVSTAGWLLADNPKEVVIAGSYVWREERWADQHAFPKAEPEIEVVKDNCPRPERELVDIPVYGKNEELEDD